MGGLFERIRRYSKFTGRGDWVFVDNESGEQLDRKVYYRLWDELMHRAGLKDTTKRLTYYSLRHTYCTMRLMAGVDVFLLARNMGTSVKYIEEHYGHVDMPGARGGAHIHDASVKGTPASVRGGFAAATRSFWRFGENPPTASWPDLHQRNSALQIVGTSLNCSHEAKLFREARCRECRKNTVAREHSRVLWVRSRSVKSVDTGHNGVCAFERFDSYERPASPSIPGAF
jgi:hypothetical protein